jgi:hypothetical protein
MKKILLLGPILFVAVVITLTILKYDFLRDLGWHPINDPTFDWPSGLALGRYGIVMTLTFIVSGGLIAFLASRLYLDLLTSSRRRLRPAAASKTGSILLAFAGIAMACLSFTTDPTIRDTPATWHGQLHDLSFVILGLTLMPSMLILGKAFRDDPHWGNLSLYTWLTAALALPTFFLKGAAFYVFLFAILVWMEVVAIRLQHNTQ